MRPIFSIAKTDRPRGYHWEAVFADERLPEPILILQKPYSIFRRKRDAMAFVAFVEDLLGGRDPATLPAADRNAIRHAAADLECLGHENWGRTSPERAEA